METGFPRRKPLWKHQWILPLREWGRRSGEGEGKQAIPSALNWCVSFQIFALESLWAPLKLDVRDLQIAFSINGSKDPNFSKVLSTTNSSPQHPSAHPTEMYGHPSPAIPLSQQLHYSWVPNFQDPITVSGKPFPPYKSAEVNTHYHAF